MLLNAFQIDKEWQKAIAGNKTRDLCIGGNSIKERKTITLNYICGFNKDYDITPFKIVF